MIDVKLPRIVGSNLEVHPISLSINLDITPLSTASMRLPKNENLPSRGYVELFTPIGSAGVFRVRSPEDAYGDDMTSAHLEHAISEVGDYLVRTEISEMMAATTAMQTIFGHYRGSMWQLGSVSALGSGNVAVQCNYDRVLDAMLSILKQKPSCMMTFDFSTSPWTVGFANKGTSVSAEGRLSRNVRSAKIITDDTELCTRIYFMIPSTDEEGEPTSVWTSVDADTKSTYGIVERELQGGFDYTESEARTAANEYLRQHKHPRVTIEIDAEELSSITGETFDKFTIGKLMRLALPDYNTTVTENITGLSWQDVFNAPNDLIVRLGDEEDTMVNFLHDVDTNGGTDGGNGGGGGGGRKKKDDEWKEYRTRFEKDDYHLALVSERVDRSDNILQAAGLDINSQTGVIIYHDDVENGVAARLTTNANAITAEATARVNADISTNGRLDVEAGKVAMVVGTNSYGNYIKAAEIVVSINQSTGEGEAKIDAGHVYIGNDKSTTVIAGKLNASDVTAEYLNAKIATIPTLTGIAASFSGNVSGAGGLFQQVYVGSGTSFTNISDPVMEVRIDGPTSNQYKLQYKLASSSSWTDAGTFSRATNLTGAWSGGTFTVNASPQGSTISAGLFSVAAADITWDGNTATFPVYANLDGGETRYNTGKTLSIDASDIYTNGYNNGYPSGTITIGSKITGSTYNVSISPTSGTAKATTKDFSSIYADARDGYTQGTFTLASVTLQGQRVTGTAYHTVETGGTVYYTAGSSVTKVGNSVKPTSVSGYRRGSSVSMSRDTIYRKGSSGSYIEIGYCYYCQSSSGASTLYKGGDYFSYNDVGTSSTLYYSGGSVTPISGGGLRLSTVTAYQAGSTVSDTYYTKS